MFQFLVYLVIIGLASITTNGQVNFFTRQDVMEGQTFPNQVSVILGETSYIRIINPVINQSACQYRRPGAVIDVNVPLTLSTSKISLWTPHLCGIRINNSSLDDIGYWRLTSSNGAEMTRGVSKLIVQASNTTARTNIQSPFDELTPENVRYCYVVRPDQNKTEFPIHQDCAIPQIDKELEANGVWNVVAGVGGQTSELDFEVMVAAKVEEMLTTVRHDTNGAEIHLGCNIVNSKKVVTFCRFLRLEDGIGYNLEEGIGNIDYSYYGSGYHKGECGMTIHQPNQLDRSTWKCYVGFVENGVRETMGAILDASTTPQNLNEDIVADDVYGLLASDVNILCKAKLAIDYCWFTHPTGRRISVFDKTKHTDSDEFRYFGTGLKLGECGVTVLAAKLNDTGSWKCHMGTLIRTGFEVNHVIEVRVSESHLVASVLRKEVIANEPVLLECTTIPVGLPIDYCRFVIPNGQGFSINENITFDNALDGKYYFNPNRQQNRGFCSILIKQVTMGENGMWTCAGRLIGRDEESGDDFNVVVIQSTLSSASIIGMTMGVIFVGAGIVFIGVRSFKKRRQRQVETRNNNIIISNNDHEL